MRLRTLLRYALTAGAAGALLAGCGSFPFNSAQSSPGQLGLPQAAGLTSLSRPYQVLHRFNLRHGVGAAQPMGGLHGYGTFYGTTEFGGRPGRAGCCGTVYSVTSSGTYNTIYAFRGEGDGASPQSGLIGAYGTLYGTTASGGAANLGTVYSISTSGAEKVLHSFTGGTDGAHPTTNLFYYYGTNIIYGTTSQGGYSGAGCGSGGCGTVFTITASGQEQVLYAFKGGSDGATPSSALIVYTDDAAAAKTRVRSMYGTTSYGGGTGCGGSGCGTVYSITTSGQETVLHSFAGGADGSHPVGLDDDRGTLLGTTVAGGKGCRGSGGCGTLYSIGTGGYKRTMYSFRGGADGACPNGPLIDIIGRAYGTTACGGGCPTEPCGTVYSFAKGTKVILYRFSDAANGFDPAGPLTNMNLTLYGTTLKGGGVGEGYGHGVVFALSP